MKILKILAINLLLLIIALIITESYFYYSSKQKFHNILVIKEKMNSVNNIGFKADYPYSLSVPVFDYAIESSRMRKPVGLNYKKAPIVLFGCSYTYGEGLKDNETISYKISELSKRPVYNRACLGWGLQHILYQLRRKDFYSYTKIPEYFIYILIDNHLSRLFRYQFPPPYGYALLRYKLVGDNFEEIHPFLINFWGMYSINYLQEMFLNQVLMSPYNEVKNLDYSYKMLRESKKLLADNYPNSKFVILVYRESPVMFIDNVEIKNKLIKEGFIIIDSDELTPHLVLKEKNYKGLDSLHPSAKAWDAIAPGLVQKLGL